MKKLILAMLALGVALAAGPVAADDAADAIAACDRLTASPFDPGRRADPLNLGEIDVEAALAACSHALALAPEDARLHFQLGRVYEASQQFDLAWEAYQQGAARDLPVSIRAVARMAYLGLGRPPDIETALAQYRKAADLGLLTAQWEYGIALLSDQVTSKDYATAIEYFEIAAFGGAPEAMRELGGLYERGDGVPRDDAKAEQWYLKAANAGHVPTMVDLGLFYAGNKGHEPDYGKARQWFERAMDAGSPDAPRDLAALYEKGRGVAADDAKAIALYRTAIDRGDVESLHSLAVRLFETNGPERSSRESAFWYYQSILHEEKPSFDEVTGNPGHWDDEFRRTLQELMTKDGFYKGPISGEFDDATLAALRVALGPRN